MNDVTVMNEQAWIEEAKRRIKLKQTGVSAKKFRIFQKLLSQRYQETGTLEREYVDQLLQKLNCGEL